MAEWVSVMGVTDGCDEKRSGQIAEVGTLAEPTPGKERDEWGTRPNYTSCQGAAVSW